MTHEMDGGFELSFPWRDMDMQTKLIVRYAVRETMGLVVMGAALFWSAGRMDWWPAWAALAVMAVCSSQPN